MSRTAVGGLVALLMACTATVDTDTETTDTSVEQDRCAPFGARLELVCCNGRERGCGFDGGVCENICFEECVCPQSMCWDGEGCVVGEDGIEAVSCLEGSVSVFGGAGSAGLAGSSAISFLDFSGGGGFFFSSAFGFGAGGFFSSTGWGGATS